MNQIWHNFLTSLPTSASPSEGGTLYPVNDCSLLKVTGTDAASFLQGQLTCDVNALSSENSFFAALCNPKGRVISTCLIFKQDKDFLLLVPTVLFEKVKNTLQKYILRAQVHLQAVSTELCLSGLSTDQDTANRLAFPTLTFAYQHNWLKLPGWQYLFIANVADSIKLWNTLLQQGFTLQAAENWQAVSIQAGLAWLNNKNSEEFIPQMLNVDKLGGISFSKGCYTGQEVIARTHYLGQSKRELVVAQCDTVLDFATDDDFKILNASGQVVGQLVSATQNATNCRFLAVLQTDALTEGSFRFAHTTHAVVLL